MSHVIYSTNGDGRWFRREWESQCSHKMLFQDRCQGIEGHQGEHWAFTPSGDYEYSQDPSAPDYAVNAAGTIPVGHKTYKAKTPAKMRKHYYMQYFTDSKVTDPDALMQLEAGIAPEKDAGIDRPCSPEEWKKVQGE